MNTARVSASRLSILAAVATLLASTAHSAIIFEPFSQTIQTSAREGLGPEVSESFNDIENLVGATNFTHTPTAGASVVEANYLVSNETEGFFFRGDFTMARPGTPQSRTRLIGGFNFSVTEATPYSFDGRLIAATSTPTFNGYNLLFRLLDDNGVVFQSDQTSGNLIAEDLVLGEQEGAFGNTLIGSPTGVLLPGLSYQLEYTSEVLHFNVARPSNLATASGFWQIELGTNSIPEPAGLGALLLGVSIALTRSRR